MTISFKKRFYGIYVLLLFAPLPISAEKRSSMALYNEPSQVNLETTQIAQPHVSYK